MSSSSDGVLEHGRIAPGRGTSSGAKPYHPGVEPLSSDTDSRAEALQIDAYRRMSPAEKLRIVFDLQSAMDAIAMVGIRERHPRCNDEEARLRLASLKLDRELLVRAFGWDPEVEGY